MQDNEKPRKRFEFIFLILALVPFVVTASIVFNHFVDKFVKMGLPGYFFILLYVLGCILFVIDCLTRKSK